MKHRWQRIEPPLPARNGAAFERAVRPPPSPVPKSVHLNSLHLREHVFPVRAAIRAVTEAAQSRLTYIGGARDDVFPETFSRPLPESTRRAFLAAPRPNAIAAPPVGGGLEALLRHTIDHLRGAGVQSAIALRLSGEALPFSVVKVFVPELESPDGERARRFGPRALSKALAS